MASLPQPPATPVLGHLPKAFDLLKLLKDCSHEFGKAFAWQMGPRYVAVFSSSEANNGILIKEASRLSAVDSFGPQSWILGQGLARLDGQSHKRMKKLLLPAFHREVLGNHAEAVEGACLRHLDLWQAQDHVSASIISKALTLQIIVKTLFGLSLQELPHLAMDLRKVFAALMVESGNPLSFLRFLNMLKLPAIPNVRRRLDTFLLERIDQPSAPESTLYLLKHTTDAEGLFLSKQELRDQLLTFIVAGHDTTAAALAWLLYELGQKPEFQERLRQELAQAKSHTPDVIRQLPFLNRVIKETLRLHPPISLGIRKTLEPLNICGYEVPQGANVVYSPYLTHRDPDLWDNPEQFYPDRFLDRQPVKFAYLPFGAGEHSCIGMNLALFELQIIVANLVKRSSWTTTGFPLEKLSPTLEPQNVQVTFTT